MSNSNFVQIENLKTYFPITKGTFFEKKIGEVRAVDGVTLNISQGEVLGLVGESGCGKSTLGRSIINLISPTSGTVKIDGKELTSLSATQIQKARLDFQMIFQDPYSSLNPRFTVYDTIAEPLLFHKIVPKVEVSKEISRIMKLVGLAPRFVQKYPHEFSGGQRQRIAIARALAVRPKLIIADEPVSALDVSIQAQILNLLKGLQKELGLTMIFVAHDLSVVKHISNRIAVMYLGKIVELGAANEVYTNPKHPYTKALISAIPIADPRSEANRQRIVLEGDPPSPLNPPSGCNFHPRCRYAIAECKKTIPTLVDYQGVKISCIRTKEING